MKLIKNANIFGETKADILIGYDRIVYIGEIAENFLPDVEIIDAKNKIVIPSYIDQHVHVTGGGGEGSFKTRCPELFISDIVKSGVSTIVGVLGTDGYTRSVENLVAKTKALKEEGFHAYCLTGSYSYPSITITGSVEHDIIFIDEVIGVKIAVEDHRSSHIGYDELKRLAAQARLAGLVGGKVGEVHVHMGAGKHGLDILFELVEKENIPITVFRPTHLGNRMDEAIKFANLGGFIDFTTGTNVKETAKQIITAMENAPLEKITISSDSNGSMPIWNDKKEMIGIGIGRMTTIHDTIKELIKNHGLTIREAIRFVTENVSKALNFYPAVGVLQKNSYADLLILDKDLNIEKFICKGKVMTGESTFNL
ncbi:MAG: beta-aspartyl-peptidase [Tissierellia bacterium]|nr:beta-aspartyl-peptidase [Tissierellia bacterium]